MFGHDLSRVQGDLLNQFRICNIHFRFQIVLLAYSCNPVEEGHALFSIGLLNTGTVNSY